MGRVNEVDAKVMYACLILPQDPEIGKATIHSLIEYTGLTYGQVRYSIKRLLKAGFIERDKKPSPNGLKRYLVSDKKQVTEQGTAWMVEELKKLLHSRADITSEKFLQTLKIPKKFAYLKDDNEARRTFNLLIKRKYIRDVHGILRAMEKTSEQRLYIELLSKKISPDALSRYQFRKTIFTHSKSKAKHSINSVTKKSSVPK